MRNNYILSRSLLIIIIMYLVAIFVMPYVTMAQTTDGLVGYWNLDDASGGVAADASGYGNDGTLENGPVWVSGKINGALEFSGMDEQGVRMHDNPAELAISGSLTLCTWAKYTVTDARIVGRSGQGGSFGYGLDTDKFFVSSDGLHAGTSYLYYTSTVNDGQWHHICGVYDESAGQIYAYVDGTSEGTPETHGGLNTASADFVIGSRDGSRTTTDNTLDGVIDDVRLYNRALTALEISEIYNWNHQGGPSDTQAPSMPTNLSVTGSTQSSLSISWSKSTDDVGVTGYNVYRDGTLVDTITSNNYTDTGLSVNVNYSYSVSAFDAAGNQSAQSNTIQVTTQAAAQTQSENYTSPVSENPLIISWPLTKAYPEIEYNIRLGVVGGMYPYTFTLTEAPSGMSIDAQRGEISWIPSLNQSGQSFRVSILVTDSAGNEVSQSFTVQVTESGFYFVSGNGDDTSGDGTLTKPWRTIDFAINQGGVDDILYVRAGTYTGRIDVDPGDINKWIAYPGDGMPLLDLERSGIHYDDDYAYFDGLEITNIKRWGFGAGKNSHAIFRRLHMHHLYDNSGAENPSFIWFAAGPVSTKNIMQDNLFHDLFDRGIEGDPSADYHGGVVIAYDTSFNLFEDNIGYNIDGRGYYDKLRNNHNTIRNNYLYEPYYETIALRGATDDEVSYNVASRMHETSQRNLTIHTGSSNFIHHNTIIGQYNTGSDNRFLDNIVISNDKPIIDARCRTADITADYNAYWSTADYFCGFPWDKDQTKQEWLNKGYDSNTLWQQPVFENSSAGNFTPIAGSFLCGTGHGGSDIGARSCSGHIQPPFSSNPAPASQCSDSVDNDGDGLIDYPADPGCSTATDNDEHNEPVVVSTPSTGNAVGNKSASGSSNVSSSGGGISKSIGSGTDTMSDEDMKNALQAQIAELLKLIDQLTAQIAALASNQTSVSVLLGDRFDTPLRYGKHHDDVRRLQAALNSLGFIVSESGAGSQGNETTYYGPATRAAVQRFQTHYDIVSGGSYETTGYGRFGPQTRTKLNDLIY